MNTRAQQDLKLAEKLISDVEKQYPDEEHKVRKTYGSLCHSFPVMVRTAGLCQAVAFSQAKAQADDERIKNAHSLLLHHVEKVVAQIEPSLGEGKLLEAIRNASATQYMLYTRRILSAWIYFKRFAESILKVKAGEDQH
jgi:CRISPR-associated protein Cmr5